MAQDFSLERISLKIAGDLCNAEIEKRTHFGWTFDRESSSFNPDSFAGRHNLLTPKKTLVFTRPENLPGIKKLDSLLEEWEKLESQKRFHSPADPFVAILCFILVIIPGIIYVAYKTKKKKKINEGNKELAEQQKKLEEEADSILTGKATAMKVDPQKGTSVVIEITSSPGQAKPRPLSRPLSRSPSEKD